MVPDTSGQRPFCAVFRPNRQEFSRPFCDYIREVCRRHPDIAMFKVIPPKGWTPHKGESPNLQNIRITHPIKQHVIGTGGAFRCFFEEHKSLTAADYKKLANTRSHVPPPKGHRQDDLLERAFWSSVTINAPIYGADTPASLFDKKVDFGWNLHDLKDLLKEYDVPAIPGVTTPMTYFGMWKSFFSWHVEDVDLYSVNYLHFGAPKVWYCVSPKDRPKFEAMAKSNFPELYNVCPAFMRHKDILFSPKLLRSYGVEYVQAKQDVGEFIVLNAGAYHSGFNLGFNCAEAVNFATADWLTTGRAATRCTCAALPDSVRLDMGMFAHGPRSSPRLRKRTQAEDDSGESAASSDSEGEDEQSSGDDDDSSLTHGSAHRSSPAAEAAPRGQGRVSQGAGRVHTGIKRGAAPAVGPSAKRKAMPADATGRAQPAKASAPDSRGGPRPRTSHQHTSAGGEGIPAAPSPRQMRHAAREQAVAAVPDGPDVLREASQADKELLSRSTALQKLKGAAEGQQRSAAKNLSQAGRLGDLAPAQSTRTSPLEQPPEHGGPDTGRPARRGSGGQAPAQVPKLAQSGHSHTSPPRVAGVPAGRGAVPQPKSPRQQQGTAASPKRRSPRSAAAEGQNSQRGLKRAFDWVRSLVGHAADAAAETPQLQKRLGSQQDPIVIDSPDGETAGPLPGHQWPSVGGPAAKPASPSKSSPEGSRDMDLLVDSKPMAIVGEEDDTKRKYFHLVQRVAGNAARSKVRVRLLHEGPDSVFRPTGEEFEEAESALIPVRTSLVPATAQHPGGFDLKTLRSKILRTELL